MMCFDADILHATDIALRTLWRGLSEAVQQRHLELLKDVPAQGEGIAGRSRNPKPSD